MDIRQYQAVYEVARQKSISRAAEALYVTQQSLSGSIRALEKELGFPLFQRTPKGSKLTPEGEQFLEAILPAIAEYEGSLRKIERIQSGKKRHVRLATALGMQEIFGYDFNVKLLNMLNDNYSIEGVTGYEYPDIQLEEFLRDGLIDLAITGPPMAYPNLEYNQLHQGKLCVYMHRDHPLARRHAIRYADLRDENFVMLVQGTKIYERIHKGCARAGFQPHIILETSNTYFINWRLHNRDCVYVGADLMPKYKDVVRVPLDDEDNKYRICLVYSKKAFKDKRMRELLKVYSGFLKDHLNEVWRAHEDGMDEIAAHWNITD